MVTIEELVWKKEIWENTTQRNKWRKEENHYRKIYENARTWVCINQNA